MELSPLYDRIVIKPLDEDMYKGVLFLPDSGGEKPYKGTVIAKGPGKDGKELQIEVGDNVIYTKFGGTEIKVEGDDLIIMCEEDVLAIIRD